MNLGIAGLLLGEMLAPTLVAFVWFTVFGNTRAADRTIRTGGPTA